MDRLRHPLGLDEKDLQRLRRGVWRAVSDLFYIPREAFKTFAALAKSFNEQKIFHEMATPLENGRKRSQILGDT